MGRAVRAGPVLVVVMTGVTPGSNVLARPGAGTSSTATAKPEALSDAGPEVGGAPAGRDALEPNRLEWGLLPAVNYNTDLGVGIGAVGTLAAFEEGFNPYRWRLQATVFASLRDQGDGIEAPLQSHGVEFDRPGFFDGVLRLGVWIGFNRQSNAGYYGLGSNAPDETAERDLRPEATQYDRTFPEARATVRIRLWSRPVPVGKRRLELFVGTSIGYTWIEFFDDSRLALDAAQAAEGGRLGTLLRGLEDHALWTLSTGLLWDTRDREFDPKRGAFHELSLRGSPGIDASLVFSGAALSLRWFVPVIRGRLTFATRSAVDVLMGDVPIYELSSLGAFDSVSAPGGGRSLRGVPLQRYHGKIKLLQSLELRGRIAPFRVAGQRFMAGAVAFVDTGRVWADARGGRVDVRRADGTVDVRDLDGGPFDFEVGVGAGARLRWGETFIIRFDFGYAPTLGTAGFYIDIGDAF